MRRQSPVSARAAVSGSYVPSTIMCFAMHIKDMICWKTISLENVFTKSCSIEIFNLL